MAYGFAQFQGGFAVFENETQVKKSPFTICREEH